MKKIFLLFEYTPEHFLPLFKKLIHNKIEIHIIEYKKNIFIPKRWLSHKKIFWYKIKDFNLFKIINLIKAIDPNSIIVAGWLRIFYTLIVFYFKNLAKKKIKIILISDNVWKNSIKQKIARIFGFFHFFYFFYDKIWTFDGPLHLLYAKKIFFLHEDIVTHLCSADIRKLNLEFKKCFFIKKKNYPKKFIFVGRFEKIKGILTLLIAWRSIVEKNGWTLHFIGEGSLNLKKITETDIDIKVSEVMPYNYLFKEIKNSGCLILPSLHEPWGMVVHEFSAAGLPLILSDQVGSRFSYLINNENGYLFNSNNVNSLILVLKKIMYQSKKNLLKMSKISVELSKKSSPDLSARALIANLP